MTAVKVVDASAIAALIFDEPEAPEIEARLAGAHLVAPTLLDFELANICWKKCRRDPDRRQAYLTAYGLLSRAPIETVAVGHAEVLKAALDTGLTAYDASYLWLSRHLGAELVTLDGKLAAFAG